VPPLLGTSAVKMRWRLCEHTLCGSGRTCGMNQRITKRGPRSPMASRAMIVILESDNIVFAQIASGLNLD